MPSLPSLDAHLSDGVVALRLSAERDIPEVLIGYQDDRGLPAALGEDRPPSGAMLGRRAELAEHELAEGRGLTLAILQEGSDVCRGEVRVSEVDWEERRAVLALWLAPAARGQGLGRRAHALAVQWLSRRSGLEASCRERA